MAYPVLERHLPYGHGDSLDLIPSPLSFTSNQLVQFIRLHLSQFHIIHLLR